MFVELMNAGLIVLNLFLEKKKSAKVKRCKGICKEDAS